MDVNFVVTVPVSADLTKVHTCTLSQGLSLRLRRRGSLLPLRRPQEHRPVKIKGR